jgi:peptidyl-prolyl cis-trans isomerase SurA
MTTRRTNPGWTLIVILVAFVVAPRMHAQGMLVDQVIAVVNGDLILESDVDEERRFEAFQPLRDPEGAMSRAAIIERLIDRTLILQQAKLQPGDRVTLPEAQAQLATVRQEIPACKQLHCEADAGWQKFVQSNGFTVPQIEELWRQRMEILKFIEIRFRSGIRITPDEIKTYYDKTLVPELARRNAAVPALDTVSDRIQEILLQQRVGSLLLDWLATLKAQGTVRMVKPGEEAP